jgi:hypothetical protein
MLVQQVLQLVLWTFDAAYRVITASKEGFSLNLCEAGAHPHQHIHKAQLSNLEHVLVQLGTRHKCVGVTLTVSVTLQSTCVQRKRSY